MGQSRNSLKVDTDDLTITKITGGTTVLTINNFSIDFPVDTINREKKDGTPGDWKDYAMPITMTGEYQIPLTSSYVIQRGDSFTGSAAWGEASSHLFRIKNHSFSGAIKGWTVGSFSAEQYTSGSNS